MRAFTLNLFAALSGAFLAAGIANDSVRLTLVSCYFLLWMIYIRTGPWTTPEGKQDG